MEIYFYISISQTELYNGDDGGNSLAMHRALEIIIHKMALQAKKDENGNSRWNKFIGGIMINYLIRFQ
ncbi:hypothetical protein SNEBB_007505 [Seison nebaliae]|nr:hypothetical protein SNEBB_007505 [Seison nebaliae]